MSGNLIPPDKIPRDPSGKPLPLRSPSLLRPAPGSLPSGTATFSRVLQSAMGQGIGGIWPVRGTVTSTFGPRTSPGLEGFHTGVDIAVPEGTPVVASADGTVVAAGEAGGYGLAVRIAHGAGVETLYGHNSALLVRPGDKVTAGQVIALSGNTGHSTGPHLHFEVLINGRPVDPMPYLRGEAYLLGSELQGPLASVPFADFILFAASRYGLDPALLAAVAKAESGFNPRAVSPAGAKGLMQLLDSTATSLGVYDPFDPQQSIEGGARYLRSLLDRFQDPILALAAYNAGPAAVERYGGIPPYRETQSYLSRVVNYWQYFKGT